MGRYNGIEQLHEECDSFSFTKHSYSAIFQTVKVFTLKMQLAKDTFII